MPLFNADGSKPQPPPPAILPGSSAPLGHRMKVVVAVPSAAQEDSLEFQALAVTAQAVKEHLGRVFGRDRVVVYDRMSVMEGEWNENQVTMLVYVRHASLHLDWPPALHLLLVVFGSGVPESLAVLTMI